jgi:hypothetical protein
MVYYAAQVTVNDDVVQLPGQYGTAEEAYDVAVVYAAEIQDEATSRRDGFVVRENQDVSYSWRIGDVHRTQARAELVDPPPPEPEPELSLIQADFYCVVNGETNFTVVPTPEGASITDYEIVGDRSMFSYFETVIGNNGDLYVEFVFATTPHATVTLTAVMALSS